MLILPVVRLDRFRKIPQEADQFSRSAGRHGGAAGCREKRSLPVEPSGLLGQGLVTHFQESGKQALRRLHSRKVDYFFM